MPKFSVVVPVYNVEKYLPACLDSLLGQMYGDLEVVAVDDGSTDDSGKILDEYAAKDKRLLVVHQDNAGVSVARNVGIAKATGDYLAFVDSDDWLEINAFAELNDFLQNNLSADYDVLMFNNRNVYADGRKHEKPISADYQKIDDFEYRLLHLGGFITDKLFKREFIVKNHLVFAQGVPLGEDGLFWIESLLKNPSIAVLDRVFYNYRIFREASTTATSGVLAKDWKMKSYLEQKTFYNQLEDTKRLVVDIKVLANLLYRFDLMTESNRFANLEFLEKYKDYLEKNYEIQHLEKYLQYRKLVQYVTMKGSCCDFLKWYQYIFSIRNSMDKQRKKVCVLGCKFEFSKKLFGGTKKKKNKGFDNDWTRELYKTCRKVGKNLYVGGETKLNKNTELGDFVCFNGCLVQGHGNLKIGNHFHSGIELLILTQNHNYDCGEHIPYSPDDFIYKDVEIGDFVWVGSRVTILPGTKIGEGAIIQAGSVVHGEIPPCAIVGGNPARVFKYRDKEHFYALKAQGRFN